MRLYHANHFQRHLPGKWGGVKSYNLTALTSIKFESVEVWKAESQVFPGSTPTVKATRDGSYSIGSSNYYCTVSSTNGQSPILSMAMDFTDWSTLQITSRAVGAWNYTNMGYWVLSSSNWKSGNWGYPTSYLNSGALQSLCTFRWEKTSAGARTDVTETKTYDISGLSGTYYLDCGTYAHSDNSDARTATIYISSIILKP